MSSVLIVEKDRFGWRIGDFISKNFDVAAGEVTVLNQFKDDGDELHRIANEEELLKTMVVVAHCNSLIAHAACLKIAMKVEGLLLRMPDRKVAQLSGYDLSQAELELGILGNVALLPSSSDTNEYYESLAVALKSFLNESS